jgi:hypothetical protein
MNRVHKLLSDLCEDLEKQVKPNLRGAIGNLVHDYLPQVWVFETERGACTLFLDTKGYARVFPGVDRDRDVTITWRHDYLETVLSLRNRDTIPSGEYPNVFVHTDKGRAAFNYLKKEIGL